MADKSIGLLPKAPDLYDDSLMVVEQQGAAMSLTGAQLRQFAKDSVSEYIEDARELAESAVEYGTRPAVIVDGTWRIWNAESDVYEDTGLAAQGPQGIPGSSIQSIDRTAGTGAPGTVDTYTITLTDGGTSEFQVYNGADGEGSGDMLRSVYDPQGYAQDVFQFVLDKIDESDGDAAALPVVPNVLAVVVEGLTLDDATPTHTFASPITLDSDAYYFLDYKQLNTDGVSVDTDNSGGAFSKVLEDIGGVRWFTATEGNSVTLTSDGITATWRTSGAPAVLSIYKASVTVRDALGLNAFSFLHRNVAAGFNAAAEGKYTLAMGAQAHAEGRSTTASGNYSHAEGQQTTASGITAHAEGRYSSATQNFSHAEGYNTTASGYSSHAEGQTTQATGNYSHAEGYSLTASGSASHAEGANNTASGDYSHAGGGGSTAQGYYAFVHGSDLVANDYQFVVGTNNVEKAAGVDGDRFIVGGGWGTNMNAFRVHSGGAVYGGAYNSSGADYAEYFEWADGNPGGEDRVGLFVTLDGDKIRLAQPEDGYIVGVVSAKPSVCGDAEDDQWHGMYQKDVFGRVLYGEDGAPLLNPEYNPDEEYVGRSRRPEWSPAGLLGKLVAVDDGTCVPGGWCTAGENGVATRAGGPTRFRVMARIDQSHVRLLIL